MFYLIPQRSGHLVNDGAQFSVFSWVADVRPGAQSDEREAQHHVADACNDVNTQEPRDPCGHIHHKDHHEQRCGCSCRVEDVLGVVVFDVLHKHLVDLRLQLQQVTPAELLPTHFLHAAKQRQCLLADAQVTCLQHARCEERPISSAHLGCKTHLMKRSHTYATRNELVGITHLLHLPVV